MHLNFNVSWQLISGSELEFIFESWIRFESKTEFWFNSQAQTTNVAFKVWCMSALEIAFASNVKFVLTLQLTFEMLIQLWFQISAVNSICYSNLIFSSKFNRKSTIEFQSDFGLIFIQIWIHNWIPDSYFSSTLMF